MGLIITILISHCQSKTLQQSNGNAALFSLHLHTCALHTQTKHTSIKMCTIRWIFIWDDEWNWGGKDQWLLLKVVTALLGKKNKKNIVSYFRVKRFPSRFHAGPFVVYSKWVCIQTIQLPSSKQLLQRRLVFLSLKKKSNEKKKTLIDFVIPTFFFFSNVFYVPQCVRKQRKVAAGCCRLL